MSVHPCKAMVGNCVNNYIPPKLTVLQKPASKSSMHKLLNDRALTARSVARAIGSEALTRSVRKARQGSLPALQRLDGVLQAELDRLERLSQATA